MFLASWMIGLLSPLIRRTRSVNIYLEFWKVLLDLNRLRLRNSSANYRHSPCLIASNKLNSTTTLRLCIYKMCMFQLMMWMPSDLVPNIWNKSTPKSDSMWVRKEAWTHLTNSHYKISLSWPSDKEESHWLGSTSASMRSLTGQASSASNHLKVATTTTSQLNTKVN